MSKKSRKQPKGQQERTLMYGDKSPGEGWEFSHREWDTNMAVWQKKADRQETDSSSPGSSCYFGGSKKYAAGYVRIFGRQEKL
ncbi:MAG: hypothetical protein HY372_01270 [Candidatus Andersenbacteria bacterium]|nr:hypothetical protein [Candidatus Andersenbacteria bacterium]